MTQPQIGSFENIPLAAIRPSTTNPRKHFDPAALEELTQSVREMGVTVPIHVRSTLVLSTDQALASLAEPSGGGKYYEIVTGERRFRAATAAGLEAMPAFNHGEMSDEAAMDLQMVENLQRADLHPVEEADGYRALMAHGESAEDVAKKAGKTLGYVQQRLKLLTLEVDAKQLFADGHLTLGHALLLARLTPRDQEKAMLFLLGIRDWELDKKLTVSENIAKRVKQRESNRRLNGGELLGRLVEPTEASLKDWINAHVLLQLKGVPWDLGDGELLPIAGPCTTCPKRTGANQALFADLTTGEDTCVDPACFGDKQKAFTVRQQALAKEAGTPLLKISAKTSTERMEKPAVEIRPSAVKMQGGKAVETARAVVVATRPVKQGQWIAAKKGSCPATVQGLAVDGADQGKTKWVCADQECKVHPRHVSSPRVADMAAPSRNMNTPENRAQQEREDKIAKLVNEAVASELRNVDAVHSNAIQHFIEFYVQFSDWAGELPELCTELGISIPGYKTGETDYGKRESARKKAEPLFQKFLYDATLPELHDLALQILVEHALHSETLSTVASARSLRRTRRLRSPRPRMRRRRNSP
jgi:ParB family chromosome partitioning protein